MVAQRDTPNPTYNNGIISDTGYRGSNPVQGCSQNFFIERWKCVVSCLMRSTQT